MRSTSAVWDKVAIDFGYRQFPAGVDEHSGLEAILATPRSPGCTSFPMRTRGRSAALIPTRICGTTAPTRPTNCSRIMKVRAAALARFGENAVPMGAPLAQLEDTLAPLYLMHRYQTEAAIKEIGGLDYRFQLRGDGQMNSAIVDAAEQRKALRAVLGTLSPEALTLPESLLKLLAAAAAGLERTRESLASSTGLTFDPIAAAESAADLTLAVLFEPQRAARLVEYNARAGANPSLGEVIDAVLAVNRPAHRPGGRPGPVCRGSIRGLRAQHRSPAAAGGISEGLLHGARRRARQTGPGEAAIRSELRSRSLRHLSHRSVSRDPAKFQPAPPVERAARHADRRRRLFDRNALRQVARLIDVGALQYGDVIGQQLHRYGEHDRRLQRSGVRRHLDDRDAILALHAGVGIGEHDTVCRRAPALRAGSI
jgi:hypothetical protein